MGNLDPRLENVFVQAVEIADANKRAAFLERACGGDRTLRQEVEALLQADRSAGDFMKATRFADPACPISAEKASERIGRYRLLERIGEGGFGVVWMAEQEEPVRRRVALKIIKLGMDTKEVVGRFEAERQALAMMDHPNIATVFDGGATETGRPYFVMELVKGVPITDYCDLNKLSARERLDLFLQVCQAVQHAHQKGVIHRDLKPSNILVTVKNDRPVPKVIDFGIAKATQARLTEKTIFTRFQQWIGTPAYMSPEQAGLGSLDVDTRSDIYSLGVLLYELLTGRTPFDPQALLAAGYDAVMRTIREAEPPTPSTRLSTLAEGELNAVATKRGSDPVKLNRLLRGDLDWIVMKALEKDRTRRYETANDFALDIGRHLNDEAVAAGPPTAGYRVKKFARKHRTAVAVAAGFVALLLLASLVSAGLALWANRERGKALRAEGDAKQARTEAEQEARNRLDALTGMQIQRAEDLFAAHDSTRAVAYLAQVITDDRSNRVAAERLLSALTARNFSLPVTEPLRHEGGRCTVQFSPNERWVVTASAKAAQVWDAQTGRPLTEPLRHEAWVNTAQFNPDGLRVVTASDDKTARIWDAQTGQPLAGPLCHEDKVWSAQFSPDGRRLVTAAFDGTARLWDAGTGKALTEPLRHEGQVWSAQFSPDGLRVATASGDKTARIWDALTGKPITPPLQHGESVWSAQFSPDGLRVVTASSDGTARIWDALTGKPLIEPLRPGLFVHFAQFSPDGARVLTVWEPNPNEEQYYLQVWDAHSGKPLTEPLRTEGDMKSAQFSPDGLRVVTGSEDKTARVWDALTGTPLAEPLWHGHTVYLAQFSPDGLRVVTASVDKTARIWDAQPGQALPEPLRHESVVLSAQFSPDGLRVVTASADKTAQVWDVQTGRPLTDPLRHEDRVNSAQFSPDGLQVLTVAGDNTTQVWDVQTGRPLTEPLHHKGEIKSATFSPSGPRVITVPGEKQAQVYDARTGEPLTEPLRHEARVFWALFSPDGLRVATASADKTARVWDARTGKPLTEPLRHEGEGGVSPAQFSPDGARLITAGYRMAQVWDVRTGKPLAEPLRHEDSVRSAQFSPDGTRVVTVSYDGSARVWDAQTGKPLTEPLRHDRQVNSAQFSPDGLRVVTASLDKTARVWDARTGKPLSEPLRHEDSVRCAQFSPDGLRVVTASDDKTARVWEVASGSVPVPAWLPQLAVAVAGKRLTGSAVFEPVATEEFLKLKEQLSLAPATNYYTRWVKWFCADRATRTISPLSSITLPEYVQRRIQENTLGSLQEAVRLSPTNGLAFARLATQVLAQSDKDNPRRVSEADFFSRRAAELTPSDPDVQRVRAEILTQIKNSSKP